jgi:hypothetical protein
MQPDAVLTASHAVERADGDLRAVCERDTVKRDGVSCVQILVKRIAAAK